MILKNGVQCESRLQKIMIQLQIELEISSFAKLERFKCTALVKTWILYPVFIMLQSSTYPPIQIYI